jgi:hypothetical protein
VEKHPRCCGRRLFGLPLSNFREEGPVSAELRLYPTFFSYPRYLITGQIALTLLLLSAAGAAIQGFVRIMRVNLGYNPHNAMAIGIPVHENTFPTRIQRANYFTQLRDKIATQPAHCLSFRSICCKSLSIAER